jgi:hypothetical protein
MPSDVVTPKLSQAVTGLESFISTPMRINEAAA